MERSMDWSVGVGAGVGPSQLAPWGNTTAKGLQHIPSLTP